MAQSMRTGIDLYRSGKYDDALVFFLALPSGNIETNHELAYYIGLCYARLERYDDALVYLEQVVTTDTDLARVYQCRMILSVLYTITGRTRLADFELRKLLDSGYESAQVFSSLAYIAWEHRDGPAAISWYEKALALDAENSNAMNGLAYILAESGTDLTRALTMGKKAVDRDPDNPAYLDSLAWVYYKLGFAAEARAFSKRARDKMSGNETIAAHYTEIQQNPGRQR